MRYSRFVLVAAIAVVVVVSQISPSSAWGLDFYDYIRLGVTPIPCSGSDTATCPLIYPPSVTPNPSFDEFYTTGNGPSPVPYNTFKQQLLTYADNERCASRYAPLPSPSPPDPNGARPFINDPQHYHFWAEDQEITALGKAVDRSRQFIFWTLMRPAVDQAIPLKQIWALNRNIALSFMIVVTAALGLAIALSLRFRSGYKFSVQGVFVKITLSLIYIALSAAIVYVLVSLSDVLMRFFIESLGGDKVFNTYFGQTSSEANYVGFVGCRDLNIRVQEAAQAEIFLLKTTIITNYMMGVMFILRKIILWFLLLVAPFLPILLSFPLIRNTGRIWIGVFFQWLFYGPLFALFFGATAKLFTDGIPYVFDFSRVEKAIGYIFPTVIRITYGGPAQSLNGLNNGNYIDTFAEYVISLVLWWAATWFPWWLLRIFRDDCCDGIYAIKNAIYGYFDKPAKPSPTPPPPSRNPTFESPPPSPLQTVPERAQRGESSDRRITVRLEDANMVRQAKTRDIITSLNLHTSTLRDVARLETNRTLVTTAKHNLALLTNPLTAQTAADRQTFLNVRTELFTRASTKNDAFAQHVLSTTAQTSQSYIARRNEMAKSIQTIVTTINNTKNVNLAQSVARTTYVPAKAEYHFTMAELQSLSGNPSKIQSVATQSHSTQEAVSTVLNEYTRHLEQPFAQAISEISVKTQQTTERVREIIREAFAIVSTEKVIETTTRVVNNILNNETALKSIATTASATVSATKQVLVTYLQHLGVSFGEVIDRIAQTTNIPIDTVRAVLHETYRLVARARTVQRAVRTVKADQGHMGKMLTQISDYVSHISDHAVDKEPARDRTAPLRALFADATIARYTRRLLKKSADDEQMVMLVQEETSLSKKQVEQALHELADAPTIVDTQVVQHLEQTAGISLVKLLQIVRSALHHAQTAQEVVQSPDQDTSHTADMLTQELTTALSPSSQVDQVIPLPDEAQSLEEYEEVRQLWVEQYRTGEVPLSDEVQSRAQWIEQEIAVITNVLTDLLSSDETVRQGALDEVGFVLPIFLMNNLSGVQLITYLKAKVSAAREVQAELAQKEAASDEESDLEEVARSAGPTNENTKHLAVDETGEGHDVADTVSPTPGSSDTS